MTTRRPNRRNLRPLAVALALSAALPTMAQALGITDLGDLNGGGNSSPTGVNAAGTVVVGSASDGASGGLDRGFIWTIGGTMRSLDILPTSSSSKFSSALGVSASGDVVVGYSSSDSAIQQAVRWTSAGVQSLGSLEGLGQDILSEARGANADGTVVVGSAFTQVGSQHKNRAFRWTESDNVMRDIGLLSGGDHASARGVNAAGNVVVGTAGSANGDRAFRWAEGGTMQDLGVLQGGSKSNAHAVNAQGNVVVGYSESTDGMRAFRWTEADQTMVNLGALAGTTTSAANAVSASGDVVVGASSSMSLQKAFRWTPTTQMQSVEEWLADAGVAVDPSLQTKYASGVSADGSVVVGQLSNNRAFIARAGKSGTGLIDVPEFMGTLSHATSALSLPLRDADPVLHGAHGNPMGWRLSPGQTSIRLAGDFGSTDRSGNDSEQQLGEVGLAHAISSNLQAQFALGTTHSRQALAFDGSARTSGTYVVPELIWQARNGLYASFSAYFSKGDVRLHRGYLNAGTPDLSSGETDATTTALRARLDWRDFWSWNNVSFTPYTSLTLSRTSTDAYTEAGGGFPVQWDKRKDKLDVLRLGLDGTKTLTGDVRLTGRVELAHRIGGDTRSSASGTILGLSSFNVDSSATQRSEWLRLGVGVDLPLGPGRFATTLNATTQGSAPAYWLAASYRMDF